MEGPVSPERGRIWGWVGLAGVGVGCDGVVRSYKRRRTHLKDGGEKFGMDVSFGTCGA